MFDKNPDTQVHLEELGWKMKVGGPAAKLTQYF